MRREDGFTPTVCERCNAQMPSKLCTKSSSLNTYATTDIDFTLKMPLPIAVRTWPLAARKMANGGLCGRDSCTFESKLICRFWNNTCEAPVSTMRSWDIGRALIAARADESSLGLRLGAGGLFQKVPFKSLVVFLFVVPLLGIVGLGVPAD
jgi:hypothetical protein